ncbi:DUF2130 domain-containing protein [Mycoplasmopsis felis]|uniref:DUF2130 domain-containing protein n=2 Tax=Mycoplasmopsis felis TaxID=33923 RepID=UPI002AFE2FA5|nr:DUF2130 domain-containing protein [Mycoplasmopsis felis]WQQ09634.1 DUF2130 domain-containing protein [Mycoplasmopsis felis]
MSKKIKISIKDINNYEFYIQENAQAGDYIDLKDFLNLNTSAIAEIITTIKSNFSDAEKETLKNKYYEEFKEQYSNSVLNSKEYLNLKEQKIKELNELQNNLRQEYELKKEKDIVEVIKKEQQRFNELLESKTESIEVKTKESFFELERKLNKEKDELNQIINKLKQEKEYLNQIKSKEIDNEKLILESKFNEEKQRHQKEKDELNQIINKLKQEKEYLNQIKSKEIDNEKLILESKFNEELNKKENEIKEKQLTIQNLNEKIDLKNQESQKLSKDLEETKNQLEITNKSRRFNSTKEVGEVYEDHLMNLLNEAFSLDELVVFHKANQIIGNNKPDFEIIFYKKNIHNKKEPIGSIIIEAKNKSTETGTKKNEDFISKLNKDKINYKADYAILSTELNPQEEIFIKRVPNFDDIYIVRWENLINLIRLLREVLLKKSELIISQIEFNNKEYILNEFNKFVQDNIEKNINIVNAKIDSISNTALSIEQEAKKIYDLIDEIKRNSFKKLNNTIEKFKNSQFIKQIDKLERNELESYKDKEETEVQVIIDEE